MEKREFVMLAHKYIPNKQGICGWYASEKLDGQRALWLPFTRGDRVEDIPFANRERDSRNHLATGLWSRYGKVIHCPDWWANKLPSSRILDGELYLGRGQFQTLSSYIRKLPEQRRDDEWKEVKYCLFDSPNREDFFRDGRIYSPNFKTVFEKLCTVEKTEGHKFNSYDQTLNYLQNYNGYDANITFLQQQRLPFHTAKCLEQLEDLFNGVLELGGEGIMLRNYSTPWEPKRSYALLKMKPVNDSEALIIGFTLGIGKLSGMMGALVVSWKGIQFELSGFTDEERSLINKDHWIKNYGVKVPIFPQKEEGFSHFFKIGEKVTFSYRELSDTGVPKEGRYLRKRNYYE